MLVTTARALAVLLLLPVLLLPARFLGWTTSPVAQIFLATIVVLSLLFVDPYVGLILGLVVLMAYARAYRAFLQPRRGAGKRGGLDVNGGNLVTTYITPAHLQSAQSNVVDDKNYQLEMIGIQGVYGEAVWGAQGSTQIAGYQQQLGGPTDLRGAQ